ncbi:MAG TPA: ComF family protein [Acidobacteriaceae bacterium]|nr:ComF family protein [Acidobacteriaceae bacterium]
MGSAFDSLTTVLFPADCRVCGQPLSEFTLLPVCNSCWNDLPAQTGALCVRCGESLAHPVAPEIGADKGGALDVGLCRICRAAAPPFEKAVAHGVYADKLRTLVHLLKYDGMEGVAGRLGALAAEQVLEVEGLPQELVVAPVPLWPGKRRQRGFNQAELLARGAVAAMQMRRPEMRVRLVAGALERRRATESQAGLSPHERRANVRGAFFVPKPAAVDGQDVLLIDDIYTTGATARACTQALKSAGARRVWVATVARAQREDALVGAAAVQEVEIPMEQDVALWDAQGRNGSRGH